MKKRLRKFIVRKLRQFLQLDQAFVFADVRVRENSVIVLAMKDKDGNDRVEILNLRIGSFQMFEELFRDFQSRYGGVVVYQDPPKHYQIDRNGFISPRWYP